MPNNLGFTDKEWERINQIAKRLGGDALDGDQPDINKLRAILKENNDNIGRRPFFSPVGLKEAGGNLLCDLLEALFTLATQLEKEREITQQLRREINYGRDEATNANTEIAKVCESIKSGEPEKATSIIENMLYRDDPLKL